LDEGSSGLKGPEGHFTAMFILTNGRLTGQQVFWNGSGTGKYCDFRSILKISAPFPLAEHFNSHPHLRGKQRHYGRSLGSETAQ